jgi:hypothetical protein
MTRFLSLLLKPEVGAELILFSDGFFFRDTL